MQRPITRAAIKAGKKNDVAGFFKHITEVTKYRDEAIIPSDHQLQIQKICDKFRSRGDLTSEQLVQISILYFYQFNKTDIGTEIIEGVLKKDPHNDLAKQEKLCQLTWNFKEEEAAAYYQQIKSTFKSKAIGDEVTQIVTMKKRVEEEKKKVYPFFESSNWEAANSGIDEGMKALGGLNNYSLDLYRMKMDPLRQLNKLKELAEFQLVVAKQTPSSFGFMQFAAQTYADANMKAEAIKTYDAYFSKMIEYMDETSGYFELIDKNAQIACLQRFIKDKIAQPHMKIEIIAKLQELGVTATSGNDSDEEEYLRLCEQQNEEIEQTVEGYARAEEGGEQQQENHHQEHHHAEQTAHVHEDEQNRLRQEQQNFIHSEQKKSGEQPRAQQLHAQQEQARQQQQQQQQQQPAYVSQNPPAEQQQQQPQTAESGCCTIF